MDDEIEWDEGKEKVTNLLLFWVMGVFGGHDHDYLYLGEEDDNNTTSL